MLLEKPDFVELLHQLAVQLKGKVVDNQMIINPQAGSGYCWAETLPSGITVLVTDLSLKECLTVERAEMEDHYFTLQFNEELANDADIAQKPRRRTDEFESFVKLSHTLNSETFVFPSTKRLRTVKFFFNKDHLSTLLGKDAFGQVLNQYFPLVMNANNHEPIATEYRVMLDDLWTDKMKQPLRLNFIQNRVLFLLEKYLVKLYDRKAVAGKEVKRNPDETLRLMKVEALLVKDFTEAPPTIGDLSRISAMSPTKLKNDFKSVYKLPIYKYYQKNRMIKAKSLLVLAKYTIKEVGIMVGYSNLSHFANTFKEEFGYLPSEVAAKDGVLIYSK